MADTLSLRLATYNLENLGAAPPGSPGLEEALRVLRPRLAGLKADILCLQEVNGQRPAGGGPRQLLALERLCADTPYADYHLASTKGPHGEGIADVHNIVTLSRWPFAASESHWHDLVAPPRYRPVTAEPPVDDAQEVRWDRPFLHCVVDHPGGKPIHILNLHLRAPLAAPVAGQKTGPLTWKNLGGWAEGFYIAVLKRSGQALEARLFVESLFDDAGDALIALCGDCNAGLGEMPLRILQGNLEDIDDPGLKARQLLAVENEITSPRRFSLLHGGRKLMLDHILASRTLHNRLIAVELHNQGLPDETSLPDSDPTPRHAPLVAAFDLLKD